MPTSMPTSSAGRGRFQPSRTVSVERFLALASRNRPWRYQGWSQAELGSLARQMPLSTFSDGEHLIRSGERGTWFGLLLAGTLGVEMADGREVLLEAGDVVGEMAMWEPEGTRGANVRALSTGTLATMLIDDLGSFLEDCTAAGGKLLRVLGQCAIARQLDNVWRARAAHIVPSFVWLEHERRGEEPQPQPVPEPHESCESQAPITELHDAYRKRLALLLATRLAAAPASAGRLDDTELTQIVELAQFQRMTSNQVVVAEGERLDSLMFVLTGTVVLERWRVEIDEGGVLGVLDYFGEGSLTASSSVVARCNGVLAGIPFVRVTSLTQGNGTLMHKLIGLLGRFGALLGKTAGTSVTKMVVTQALYRPINVGLFLSMQSLFRGDSARQLVEVMRTKFKGGLLGGIAFFSVSNMIMFSVPIPFLHPIIGAIAGLIFNVWLAIVAYKK